MAVVPLTYHQPPPAEVPETMGRVTPWEISWITRAVVLGAVRKFTPSGAMTVTEVGGGDADGVGDGRGDGPADRGLLAPHPATTAATTTKSVQVTGARMCITYSDVCSAAAIRW